MLKEFLKNLRESENCRNLEGQKQELYVIMDMNRIHRDNQANFPGIANLMLESNAELLYIPPCSPQLNPL
jgi:transposase